MKRQVTVLSAQKRPSKFILGYLLWKTGLCKLFTFKVDGVKFRFFKSNLSMQMFIDPGYIDNDLNYLKQYLKTGNSFIDVGANIGSWTNLAARAVGPSGKVMCFEPHPLMFTYLEGNIQLNQFNNIAAYNVGCSDEAGQLYFSQDFDSMNHVTYDSVNSITIPVNKLDAYTESLDTIDLIKIDVEGFELNVLRGAKKTLAKTRVVIFESNSVFQNKYGYKTSDIITLLNSLRFRVYRVKDHKVKEELGINYTSLEGEDLVAFNENV